MKCILKLVEIERTEEDNNPPPSLTGCLTGCQDGLCVAYQKCLHTKHTYAALFQIKPMPVPLRLAKRGGKNLVEKRNTNPTRLFQRFKELLGLQTDPYAHL